MSNKLGLLAMEIIRNNKEQTTVYKDAEQ